MSEKLHTKITIGRTPVWQIEGDTACLFVSGMAIDGDGAPKAYHPKNTGLDWLGNAHDERGWFGVVTDAQGHPVVQGPNDPAPGYYVSPTSLSDPKRPRTDPRAYVDASTIPYIALPGPLTKSAGIRLGDLAIVLHRPSGKHCCAIFADGGPSNKIGEGSIALAHALGIPDSPKNGGVERPVVAFLVFPGSRKDPPMPASATEIATMGEAKLKAWGGLERLTQCAAQIVPRGMEPADVRAYGPVRRPSLDELE